VAATVIEEIKTALYRAEIPLPGNPLKATNSYIIRDEKRNLVIDTGMKRSACREAMKEVFEQLALDPEKTDFFVTHMHIDHIGLVDEFSTVNSVVYFNRPDAEILNYKNIWELIMSMTERHGFPAEMVNIAVGSHPGQRYEPKTPEDFTLVEDGDVIRYGCYELHCIMTPGHSPGHTCLYEPEQKLLLSGDHILGDITPNITTWLDESNPLGNYFTSLDRIRMLPVELVLPGHRRIFTDCRKRIEELKEHHRQRLEEVIAILCETGPVSAFDVASRMTWDLVAEGWDDFPLMQKWFATGEALAHLRHLEYEGRIRREQKGKKLVFLPAAD